MTMCGSLRAVSHRPAAPKFNRSGLVASASSTPRVIRSTAATAPDRANLETYCHRRNSPSRSIGTANDRPVSATRQTAPPITALPRRTRNGSLCHSSRRSGIASSTARPTFQARPGIMASTKENVARSMIIRSTNVAVIMSTSCLNCDTTVRMTTMPSDNAPAVSGRRSKASQKKLSRPQVRTNAACALGSTSKAISSPSAAR